jgi:hypothetical protein
VLISYVENKARAYITLFPVSEEGLSHLSAHEFVLISQSLKLEER